MLLTRRRYGNPKIEKEAGNELEFDANHELLWADLVKLGTSPGGKRPKALINVLVAIPSSLSFQKEQFMTIKGREIGINKTTCDIMQKELNDKYSSFRSS